MRACVCFGQGHAFEGADVNTIMWVLEHVKEEDVPVACTQTHGMWPHLCKVIHEAQITIHLSGCSMANVQKRWWVKL